MLLVIAFVMFVLRRCSVSVLTAGCQADVNAVMALTDFAVLPLISKAAFAHIVVFRRDAPSIILARGAVAS